MASASASALAADADYLHKAPPSSSSSASSSLPRSSSRARTTHKRLRNQADLITFHALRISGQSTDGPVQRQLIELARPLPRPPSDMHACQPTTCALLHRPVPAPPTGPSPESGSNVAAEWIGAGRGTPRFRRACRTDHAKSMPCRLTDHRGQAPDGPAPVPSAQPGPVFGSAAPGASATATFHARSRVSATTRSMPVGASTPSAGSTATLARTSSGIFDRPSGDHQTPPSQIADHDHGPSRPICWSSWPRSAGRRWAVRVRRPALRRVRRPTGRAAIHAVPRREHDRTERARSSESPDSSGCREQHQASGGCPYQ